MSRCTLECLDCGTASPFEAYSTECEYCGSQWREARYDYLQIGKRWPASLTPRSFDMWRFHDLLPVEDEHPSLSMGEGGTPLIHAPNLGLMLGCPNIYIKDERQGPTHSFKDRQAAAGVAVMKEAGITEAVLASTGNVAISYSAYAARAGIKLWAFITSLVPAEKMREVAIYGTQVIKVTGSYDQAKQLAAEFARQRHLYQERGPRSVASVESMKTIAFEISEQLTYLRSGEKAVQIAPSYEIRTRPRYWRVPDWYFQSVSGGLGPLGVQKGFWELYQMGLTERLPSIACIQVDGCSPMVHAWKQGLETADPVYSPRTHIATLSTGDPGRTYSLLRQRMLDTSLPFGQAVNPVFPGGLFESVTDEEAFRAIHILAKLEGISVEPAAAVAFAGLIKLVRAGIIKPHEVIVINCTGHTMPVEPIVLGDRWAQNVVAPSAQVESETPQEGLLAALNRVTADRFSRIAIVDDHADARRLIRRILQSQGNYTIFEAADGQSAIELAQKEAPDLIILDLMMPEMDGFAVLDTLREKPQTAHIPVIVVTAKELTVEEKKRLDGQIHSLMQKGEFLNDDLLDEVRTLVA